MQPTTDVPTALDRYYRDVGRVEVLTAEQEVAHLRSIRTLQRARWMGVLVDRAALPVIRALLQAVGPSPRGIDLRAVLRAARQPNGHYPVAVERFAAAMTLRDVERLLITRIERDVVEWAGPASPLGKTVQANRRVIDRAVDQFIRANLRLVLDEVKPFRRASFFEDLIQEGNIGLVRALNRFELERGLKYATYAKWWIRHEVHRCLEDRGHLVRLPVHLQEDLARARAAEDAFATRHGYRPSPTDLSTQLGIPPDRLHRAVFDHQTESLDAPIRIDDPEGSRDGSVEWGEAPIGRFGGGDEVDGPETSAVQLDERAIVQRAIANLPPREARIIRLRFGTDEQEGMTLDEIRTCGLERVSRERLRQLQNRALGRLSAELDDLLDLPDPPGRPHRPSYRAT